MAHLTRPAEISGVSAGSFPETAAGNRAYLEADHPMIVTPVGIRTIHLFLLLICFSIDYLIVIADRK